MKGTELRIGNHLKWKDNQQKFKVTKGNFYLMILFKLNTFINYKTYTLL